MSRTESLCTFILSQILMERRQDDFFNLRLIDYINCQIANPFAEIFSLHNDTHSKFFTFLFLLKNIYVLL